MVVNKLFNHYLHVNIHFLWIDPKPSHVTQHAEWDLNRIEKTFDGTFTGWKSMYQGFRIYFVWNPRLKGHRNGQLDSLAKLAWSGPSWLFLWPLILDFKQNIFWTLGGCSFTLQRSCWKYFQFYSNSTGSAVSRRWRLKRLSLFLTQYFCSKYFFFGGKVRMSK